MPGKKIDNIFGFYLTAQRADKNCKFSRFCGFGNFSDTIVSPDRRINKTILLIKNSWHTLFPHQLFICLQTKILMSYPVAYIKNPAVLKQT